MKKRGRIEAVVEEIFHDVVPSWNTRFWSKVDKCAPCQLHIKTRCWVWVAAMDDHGYGVFWVSPRLRRATHVAFFLHYKRWPKNCALHKCDNPACVRWNHLFDGTKQDNTEDMIRKGRARHAHGENVGSAKLTIELVRRIRREVGSSRAVGTKFGVSHMTISGIRRGKGWRHV